MNEYTRLIEEIKSRGIKCKDIQELLNINKQALSCKLHGRRNARFSVEQAIAVKEMFFPDMTVEELFKK
jgi:hypothetical protein